MANGKDTYYFSHDSNARNDEKILMLRAEHGWEGYGLYWALIEMMFESKDTALYHDKIKGLALSYNTDITLLQGVINTAITERLFVSNDSRFWSESLVRRKAAFHESREKKSLAGKKGMASRWGTDNTLITKDNKGKESKVKEKKVKEKESKEKVKIQLTDFVKMTSDQHQKLINEHGERATAKMIEMLDNYKGAKGTKYKCDYRAILNWVTKKYYEEYPPGQPQPKEKKVLTEEEKQKIQALNEQLQKTREGK